MGTQNEIAKIKLKLKHIICIDFTSLKRGFGYKALYPKR